MTNLTIDFTEKKTTFQPGDEVSGTISWSLEKAAHKIELRLFWFTRGKGTEDAGIVDSLKFEQPLQNETRSFRFRLPEAPYSFSGALISLIWAVELIVYPTKEVVRRELEVGPEKHEVRLPTVTTASPAQAFISINSR
jgi:hypothetical protein